MVLGQGHLFLSRTSILSLLYVVVVQGDVSGVEQGFAIGDRSLLGLRGA